MKISVITVVLNAAQHIGPTLQSVLDQKKADFECIVFDGGSTDGTWEIVCDIAKRHPGKIKSFQGIDSGIYDAMNQAIPYAVGHYVTFLNAGDRYHEDDALQNLTPHMGKGYEAIVCNPIRYNGSGKRLLVHQKKLNYVWITGLCHQTVFFKNKDIRFKTEFRLAADFRLIWECFHRSNGNFYYCDKHVIEYMDGGLSDRKSRQVYREIISILIQSKFHPWYSKIINLPLYAARMLRG